LVLVIGSTVNSAKAVVVISRWISITTAELAKISIIVGMAMVLAERKDLRGDPTDSDVAKSLLVAAIPVGLILLQPDLGTVLIISAAVVAMIGASGAPIRWVVGLILLAIAGGFAAVQTGVVSEYQVNRLQSFIDPAADPQLSGYQLRQARITIGSGDC
jgi:rod shape determining protein RodA